MPRVVIIGAGAVGLCCAWYARQRGFDVTVVERLGPQRDGCSFGNAGMIVPSHFIPLAAPGMVTLGLKWMFHPESPFYIRPRFDPELFSWAWRFWRACTPRHVDAAAPRLLQLHLESRAEFQKLHEEVGGFDLVQGGMLILCQRAETLDEEARTAERARALGIAAERLDAAAAQALEPETRLNIAGAVHYPDDCQLSPRRFMERLQSALEARGVAFHWNQEVRGFLHGGSRIAAVSTGCGELPGDEFVLAGGAWSARIARPLPLNLPLQAGKGYSLTLERPERKLRHGMILAEGRVAVTPMGPSLRFGGTMELSGLDERIDVRRVSGIVKTVQAYLPDFPPERFRGVAPWAGLRPCSPDGLPYLGRTVTPENLILAAGHAMMGISLAPATGRIVGSLLAGEPPGIELSLFRPERFSKPRKGLPR